MTRRWWLLMLALPVWGADLPRAETLLDRFVEVTGGKQAYESQKSAIAHGTVDYAAMGLKGKVTLYTTSDGFYRMKMDMAGVGALETGVKDGVAWERSDLLGPRVKTGLERAEAIREAEGSNLPSPKWREFYSKVETAGEAVAEGEECYKIAMTPTEGTPETLYLSKKSGLVVKFEATSHTQMGDIPAEMLFADYKEFGGVLTPSRMTQKAAGQVITIVMDSVDVNATIPADLLELPPDVAALVAKPVV